MMQRDYILRMIEQLSRVLIRILNLREAEDYEGALSLINDVFKQTLGLSSDFINSLSDETLLAMLTSVGTLNVEKCFLAATLLKAEGEIKDDQDNPDKSYYCYLKALHLFLAILLSDEKINDQDLFLEIEKVLSKLEPYELPFSTKPQLFQYFERTGRYAKAEDMLFEVIEASPDEAELDVDIFQQGSEFYERLRKKNDLELAAGDFSREEIEEGLAHLQRMRGQAL